MTRFDEVLLAIRRARGLYRLYDHFQNRRWTSLARLLTPYIPVPKFTPGTTFLVKENALGINACSAAILLYYQLDVFYTSLAEDERISRLTSEFRGAIDLARLAVRKFVSQNFDQPTIEASAKEVGLEGQCTIESERRADIPTSFAGVEPL